MRRNKPLALVAGAALFDPRCMWWRVGRRRWLRLGRGERIRWPGRRNQGRRASGPRRRDRGRRRRAGPSRSTSPATPVPTRLDPTDGWSVTGNSIQQALTQPFADPVRRATRTASPILVPDLATDLGTPNEDFTEWTFTIRDDATWEDGEPVTAEEVAFGICRSLDSDAFPSGPGTEYSKHYFVGARSTPVPTPARTPTARSGAASPSTARTSPSRWPSRSRTWTTGAPSWRWARLRSATPPSRRTTARTPLSNGPYKVESFRPNEELVLVKNDQWNPDSDPARHQYADKLVFKFNEDQAKVDQIMLSDNTESQTAVVDRARLGQVHRGQQPSSVTAWCSRPSQCV